MVNNDVREIELRLNGIPIITRVMLSSHHISRWWPSDDLYYLTAAAEIGDPDGSADIDSVWMEIQAGQDVFALERTGQNGTYEVSVTEQELSVPSLYYLQGKPIIVYCRDLLENIGHSDKMYIPRIIEETPGLVSPTALEEVGSAPITFEWEPVFPGFSYTFRLEIYQINLGVYNKIHEFTQLPPGSRTFTFEQPLDAGDYFWVLYIIDDFGDSSRSKEGAFRVN
jgi:hypothetical protein